MKFDKIPNDVFLLVSRRLSAHDIFILRNVNKWCRYNVNCIAYEIVNNELSKHDYMHSKTQFGMYIINYNNHNIFELYIAFMFKQLNTCLIPSTYYINFIESFKNTSYIFELKKKHYTFYYRYHCFSLGWFDPKRICTISTLIILHKTVITIPVLCKLFAITYLDLSKSILVECCEICNNKNLANIVLLKYNNKNDVFLHDNYLELKRFLVKQPLGYTYYNKLLECEISVVNKHIIYSDPSTYKQYRLSSKSSNRFINSLLYENVDNNLFNIIDENIKTQQSMLLYTHFGTT